MPYCKNNDSKFKWDGLNPNEKLAEPDQQPTNKERKKNKQGTEEAVQKPTSKSKFEISLW